MIVYKKNVLICGWLEQESPRDEHVSFNSICTELFGIKLETYNGSMVKLYHTCSCCHKQVNLVLTVNIRKRNDLFKICELYHFLSSGYLLDAMKSRVINVYFKKLICVQHRYDELI